MIIYVSIILYHPAKALLFCVCVSYAAKELLPMWKESIRIPKEVYFWSFLERGAPVIQGRCCFRKWRAGPTSNCCCSKWAGGLAYLSTHKPQIIASSLIMTSLSPDQRLRVGEWETLTTYLDILFRGHWACNQQGTSSSHFWQAWMQFLIGKCHKESVW